MPVITFSASRVHIFSLGYLYFCRLLIHRYCCVYCLFYLSALAMAQYTNERVRPSLANQVGEKVLEWDNDVSLEFKRAWVVLHASWTRGFSHNFFRAVSNYTCCFLLYSRTPLAQ